MPIQIGSYSVAKEEEIMSHDRTNVMTASIVAQAIREPRRAKAAMHMKQQDVPLPVIARVLDKNGRRRSSDEQPAKTGYSTKTAPGTAPLSAP